MTSPHQVSGTQYDVKMSPLPEGIRFERDVPVTMRDGVVIRVNVFRPAAEGCYPVIMAASPYGKDAFEAIKIFSGVPDNHIGHIAISDHVAFEAPDPAYWVPNGYVVIQVDIRGQGRSEGATLLLGPDEQQDYVELIEWAAKAPWSNGSVGLNGVSYLAFSQWFVAQHRPPGLKAIVPWEGFNDFYLRNFFGGIPEVGFWQWVIDQWVKPLHNPDYPLIEGPPASEHPLKDDFWDMVSPNLAAIDVPALICASFSDQGLHSRDSFEAYKTISSEKKWLYSHRQPKWHAYYAAAALELQRRFMDRFLKGDAAAMDDQPLVRVEINETRDRFTVRDADRWPIEGTRYVPYYLGDAELTSKPSQPLRLSYDAEEGSVWFDLKFSVDTEIVGHSKLKLWVEAEGADDLDLFVGLTKIDADGNTVYFYGFGGTNPNDIVARGFLRASHRELDPVRSTEWQPVHLHRSRQKLAPGEIVPVEVEIFPSATLFKRGETLRLIVQGRPIEPDAVLLRFEPANRGTHTVHIGGEHDSHLLLPVLGSAETADAK